MSENEERARAEELLPAVYDELRAIAGQYLRREGPAHTLQPTALVHEAFLRVQRQSRVVWRNPGHLRAVAAQAMRRLLVDHARRRGAEKRGGERERVTLSDAALGSEHQALDVLVLEDALERLAALHGRQARLVELRFFGGMTNQEAADVLGVSVTTVEDDWRIARAWLGQQLEEGTA